MPSALVTGANSGIGHEFAKVLIKDGYDVLAVDINVEETIKSLGCKVAQLDVTKAASIDALQKDYGDGPLDLLLNIAGIIAPQGGDTLETIGPEVLAKVFAVNTFGPMLLTQAFLPNLLKSSHPRIGMMSSRVGSIGDNSSGGSYAYRASKAALNSICKSLSVDLKLKGVIVVVMHPGIVRTGLVPTSHQSKEAVDPDEAAQKLWKVFQSKKLEDTGRFWHREGQELPW